MLFYKNSFNSIHTNSSTNLTKKPSFDWLIFGNLQIMRRIFYLIVLPIFLFAACTSKHANHNVILIFADDMGYGDLGCYGNPVIQTPHLDLLAQAGVRYTQFYVTSPVCSPSRSSLLSGCYPKRLELHKHVLFPNYTYGINPEEELLPELFKKAGYTTACYGKWHLGHHLPFLPLQNGFDEYFGLPFSNDMSKAYQASRGNTSYPYLLPLMEGNDTIELDPDQSLFTKRLTEKCLQFIDRNSDRPFFIYFAHPMPHIPIHASDDFLGTSKRGLYGDVIEEIDWSVGEITKALREHGLLDNSFVFFSSDNGPWLPFKTHGGSAGPLRGGKGSTWEGGMREPCIIHWPLEYEMPSGTNAMVWSSIDLLPTLVNLCNLESPRNFIDGKNRLPQFQNQQNLNPEPIFYYSAQGYMEGVRLGPWKLLQLKDSAYLFNLEEDVAEKYNLIIDQPALADSLKVIMLDFDSQMDANMRSHGQI